MVNFNDLKPMVIIEQLAAQDWAKAAVAWAEAAASWEAAVEKTPDLSEVRARWASARKSWIGSAHAWAPGFGQSWLPGNHQWTCGSCNWAAAARRWGLASLNWAAAAQRYPACAWESLPCASSAVDWSSAAKAWANPQSIWDEPMFELPIVANLFAMAAESAADVAAWASAGRRLPPLNSNPWSVAEMHKALGRPWMENAVYGRRQGVEATPASKAPLQAPSPTKPSLAESGKGTQTTQKDTAPNAAGAESSATNLQDQARGKASLAEEVKPGAVAVDHTAAEMAVGKKTSDQSDLKVRQAYTVALPEVQARGNETGTSVNGSLAEKVKQVAVKSSGQKSSTRENKSGEVLDLKNAEEFPAIPPADPTQRRPPKPRRDQNQHQRQG